MNIKRLYLPLAGLMLLALGACNNYFKNDYDDNSPTSGKLNVYYDEGLARHVINQALTFESQYPNAQVKLFGRSEDEAVKALYDDSCEAIVISRQLNAAEKKAFESKGFFPKFSPVAVSGLALITNSATPLRRLSYQQVITLLSSTVALNDSSGNAFTPGVLLDKNNSSLVHYVVDSLLKGRKLSANCNILANSLDAINYVAANKNTIACVDFAWLSDVDDSLYKANKDRIKFLAIGSLNDSLFEFPNQSSFKLGTYALARTVYVYRKTGDFTLAKGFESFVAGPKGQLIFLKQGLLPTRQGERSIKVNTGAIPEQ